jgi:hypothetical protein
MWEVYDPDDGDADDARKVCAGDAQEAVERWASRYDADSAEYSIVGGQSAVVRVRRAGDDAAPWEDYEVEGHQEAVYYAHKVDAAKRRRTR